MIELWNSLPEVIRILVKIVVILSAPTGSGPGVCSSRLPTLSS